MTIKAVDVTDLVADMKTARSQHYAAQYGATLVFMAVMRCAVSRKDAELVNVVAEGAVQVGYLISDMLGGDDAEREAATHDAMEMAGGLFQAHGAMR